MINASISGQFYIDFNAIYFAKNFSFCWVLFSDLILLDLVRVFVLPNRYGSIWCIVEYAFDTCIWAKIMSVLRYFFVYVSDYASFILFVFCLDGLFK